MIDDDDEDNDKDDDDDCDIFATSNESTPVWQGSFQCPVSIKAKGRLNAQQGQGPLLHMAQV